MLNHQHIDARLLALVRVCVGKIDADLGLLDLVRENVDRIADPRIRAEWQGMVSLPWPELRGLLLAESEVGAQLRQNAPFGRLLTNAERLPFFESDFTQRINRALDLSEIQMMDRLCDILDELHFLRMNVSATATRLGIPAIEVEAARAYEHAHCRELFIFRQGRRDRGVVRVLRPLNDSEMSETQAALDEDRNESHGFPEPSRAELEEFAKKILTLAATDRIAAWRRVDTSLCGGRNDYATAVLEMIERGATDDDALASGIAVAVEKGWPARLRRRLT